MIYKRPSGMRFTTMCIYIDENVPKIINAGEFPEIESTVYNYLWLLVKALAIKKRMFNKFEDYDGYAFYAATRLFLALRKNYINQGKVIKGKEIRPVKSCLNYTKALLYPMKIEYQRETFKEIIEEEFVSKQFDAFTYKEKLKSEARANSDAMYQLKMYLQDSFRQNSHRLDTLLQKSPFNPASAEYKNLKISVLLTSIYILKKKKKLIMNGQTGVVLWHLPKNMSEYVKFLVKEFFSMIKGEIIDCYNSAIPDDDTINNILNSNLEESNFENQY